MWYLVAELPKTKRPVAAMPETEADTCRMYVLPKLYEAGWNDEQIARGIRSAQSTADRTGSR